MKNLVKNATRHLVSKAYETFTKGKKISVLYHFPAVCGNLKIMFCLIGILDLSSAAGMLWI